MEPPSRSRENSKLRLEDWLKSFTRFDPPDQATLEASVEVTYLCGKCGGKVRAVCLQAQKADGPGHDLDILVSVHCRDAKCEWKAQQWRPWSRHHPKEL